jgi:DtxR family Mn-dependent transcriptional regulator
MTQRGVSPATEDYLKAIYDLGGEGVKTQALAEALSVSAASVSGMLKKLHELNLISYEKYRGVSLTPAGRKIALETLRHHRLIETYLSEVLDYPWHELHDEAERLEHVISEAFEARIAEALGHPDFDPHGDPIPQLDGSLPESLGCPLTELEPGRTARLTRIADQRREVLVYLESHGLKPGAELEVVARAPLSGPVTLRCGDQQLALSLELAGKLHAAPLDGPESSAQNP